MELGQLLAWAFILGVAGAFILAVLADLEKVPLFRRLSQFARGKPGSRCDRFLRVNATVNRLLSVIAAALLISFPLLKGAIDQVNGFIEWSATQALAWRIFAILAVSYLFLGIAVQLWQFVKHELHVLISGVSAGFSNPPDLSPDEQALVAYRHPPKRRWFD